MGKDDEPSDGEINGLRLRILMLEKQLEGSTFWVEGKPFTTCSVPALEVLKAMYAVPTTELMTYAKVPFPGAPSPALREACEAELKRRKEEGE